MFDKSTALADLDAAIDFAKRSKTISECIAHLHSCITRYTRPDSSHRTLADQYLKISVGITGGSAPEHMLGVARSLREEIDRGFLQDLQSLVTADLFADLLAQAEHLVDENYRRAAAVLAGATLEEHLRKLAIVNAISTTGPSGPTKASTLNAELKKANVYGKAEQAQIDAWQKLRNDAAHGVAGFETTNTDADIARMIAGIRDFLVKHPP